MIIVVIIIVIIVVIIIVIIVIHRVCCIGFIVFKFLHGFCTSSPFWGLDEMEEQRSNDSPDGQDKEQDAVRVEAFGHG